MSVISSKSRTNFGNTNQVENHNKNSDGGVMNSPLLNKKAQFEFNNKEQFLGIDNRLIDMNITKRKNKEIAKRKNKEKDLQYNRRDQRRDSGLLDWDGLKNNMRKSIVILAPSKETKIKKC